MNMKTDRLCCVCNKEPARMTVIVMLTTLGIKPRDQESTKSKSLCSLCAPVWARLATPEVAQAVDDAFKALAERQSSLRAFAKNMPGQITGIDASNVIDLAKRPAKRYDGKRVRLKTSELKIVKRSLKPFKTRSAVAALLKKL